MKGQLKNDMPHMKTDNKRGLQTRPNQMHKQQCAYDKVLFETSFVRRCQCAYKTCTCAYNVVPQHFNHRPLQQKKKGQLKNDMPHMKTDNKRGLQTRPNQMHKQQCAYDKVLFETSFVRRCQCAYKTCTCAYNVVPQHFNHRQLKMKGELKKEGVTQEEGLILRLVTHKAHPSWHNRAK